MAKKNSSDDVAAGVRIQVRSGTTVPEFPEMTCGGWTGTIIETSGKKPNLKCVIEWDETTLSALPPTYVEACESRGLYYRMACLDASAVEPAPGP